MSRRSSPGVMPAIALALPRVALSLAPHWRRRLIGLSVLSLIVAVAYIAWFRDSSLVRVQRVTVSGLTTPQAGRLRAELTHAALGMTTLHIDQDALRRAVGNNPLVRSIEARSSFPHTLRIEVGLGVPVAALRGGGRTVAVAADGTLLPDLRTDTVPAVDLSAAARGGRLARGAALDLVTIAAAAPPPLSRMVESISRVASREAVAHVRRGPTIVLGDLRQLAAKWASAAAVLAAPSSQGATYVDVRDPARPVAGGLKLASAPQALPSAPGTTAGGPGAIPAGTASDALAGGGQPVGAAGAAPAGVPAGQAGTLNTAPTSPQR